MPQQLCGSIVGKSVILVLKKLLPWIDYYPFVFAIINDAIPFQGIPECPQ